VAKPGLTNAELEAGNIIQINPKHRRKMFDNLTRACCNKILTRLLLDSSSGTLSIHAIPFFIFCIFLGGWLSALHHSFPPFLLLLAFFLAKIDTVKRTGPA
jgi:hypothetical protein